MKKRRQKTERVGEFVELPTAGGSIVTGPRAGAAIAELGRLSGFTWDQLARLST